MTIPAQDRGITPGAGNSIEGESTCGSEKCIPIRPCHVMFSTTKATVFVSVHLLGMPQRSSGDGMSSRRNSRNKLSASANRASPKVSDSPGGILFRITTMRKRRIIRRSRGPQRPVAINKHRDLLQVRAVMGKRVARICAAHDDGLSRLIRCACSQL